MSQCRMQGKPLWKRHNFDASTPSRCKRCGVFKTKRERLGYRRQRNSLRRAARRAPGVGESSRSSTVDAMSCTICVPLVPPSGNVLRRKYRHWAAYSQLKATWKRTIWALVSQKDRSWLEAMCEARKPMRVEICISHGRKYDTDNAYAGVKPLLDGLRELKFLYQDDPQHLSLKVTQENNNTNETRIFLSEA